MRSRHLPRTQGDRASTASGKSMIWEKIRAHDQQREMFRRAMRRRRLSHAYLFFGPEGVGKKLFARALAQCLFCSRFDDAELEACGECSACRQMAAGTHSELLEVGCPEGKSELQPEKGLD